MNNLWSTCNETNPQLSETEVDSDEYRKQMKSLIDYMLGVGYKKKIVNDYVLLIKEKHLNPSLILLQMKNEPNTISPNNSEDPLTG
jgi:hypothetical protein